MIRKQLSHGGTSKILDWPLRKCCQVYTYSIIVHLQEIIFSYKFLFFVVYICTENQTL